MISYWRSIVGAIVSGALLVALFGVLGGRANDTSPVTGEAKDITPVETKILCTIPASRYPGKPGTLLYDRYLRARGLAVSNGHIQVWDSKRLLEFDQEGELVSESEAPDDTPIRSVHRSGPWVVSLEYREGFSLRLSDQHGAEVTSLPLPEDEYPHPHLLQYYDGESYLGIFGTEPEEVRSLTLYSISPEGLTLKIRLPARVLFGGMHRQLMPDGTKYYIEYLPEQDCYEIVRETYSLEDLGLVEAGAD